MVKDFRSERRELVDNVLSFAESTGVIGSAGSTDHAAMRSSLGWRSAELLEKLRPHLRMANPNASGMLSQLMVFNHDDDYILDSLHYYELIHKWLQDAPRSSVWIDNDSFLYLYSSALVSTFDTYQEKVGASAPYRDASPEVQKQLLALMKFIHIMRYQIISLSPRTDEAVYEATVSVLEHAGKKHGDQHAHTIAENAMVDLIFEQSGHIEDLLSVMTAHGVYRAAEIRHLLNGNPAALTTGVL